MQCLDGKRCCLLPFCFRRLFFSVLSFRDPLTGLGTLNFTAFLYTAMKLQLTFAPTVPPTVSPTLRPSTIAPTTASPTVAPTVVPPLVQFFGLQV
jgi:hypothetical protein